jgi:hypothetical protein
LSQYIITLQFCTLLEKRKKSFPLKRVHMEQLTRQKPQKLFLLYSPTCECLVISGHMHFRNAHTTSDDALPCRHFIDPPLVSMKFSDLRER